MKIWFRKIIGISLIAVLSAALLAGCGGNKEETETETTTSETRSVETPDLDAKVGQVVSLNNGALVMDTSDGKTLEFDISGVNKVNRESIIAGNTVAVVYSGVVTGTDTSEATVELVIAMSDSEYSGSGVSGQSSGTGSQISGTVIEYIEGSRLVIEGSADGEYYYFSAENAVVSNSADIEEGDMVTVTYTGDLEGDDLVPATRISVSSSAGSSSGGTSGNNVSDGNGSGSGSSGSGFSSSGTDKISGTVVSASMNTVTIRTSSGTRYTFSTIDADMASAGDLSEGTAVTLYYTGDLSEGAETVTVTSVEAGE